VIRIRTAPLEFPCDLRSGELSREEDVPGLRPGRHVRTTAPIFRISVSRTEPLWLAICEHAMFRAVRASDTNVRPVVAGITLEMAILVKDPAPIRRPTGAEVKMIGIPCDPHAIGARRVTRPDFEQSPAPQPKDRGVNASGSRVRRRRARRERDDYVRPGAQLDQPGAAPPKEW